MFEQLFDSVLSSYNGFCQNTLARCQILKAWATVTKEKPSAHTPHDLTDGLVISCTLGRFAPGTASRCCQSGLLVLELADRARDGARDCARWQLHGLARRRLHLIPLHLGKCPPLCRPSGMPCDLLRLCRGFQKTRATAQDGSSADARHYSNIKLVFSQCGSVLRENFAWACEPWTAVTYAST